MSFNPGEFPAPKESFDWNVVTRHPPQTICEYMTTNEKLEVNDNVKFAISRFVKIFKERYSREDFPKALIRLNSGVNQLYTLFPGTGDAKKASFIKRVYKCYRLYNNAQYKTSGNDWQAWEDFNFCSDYTDDIVC
jgi:hypothetical protein